MGTRKQKTLEDEVLETITKYNLIEAGDKIILGVSGGPDSITMLDILYKLKDELNFEISVCHVNHGLRENAKLDEEFVEKFCKDKNIDFNVLHVNIKKEAKNNKTGLEETGRKIRYEFFDEILSQKGFNKIAIAHNKNDNAETVIMNILRGCGINGLRGIEPKNKRYIRPLLEVDREKIENYCKQKNIAARHDESNDENLYTRNKIRNLVIPYIKENFNPNIIESLNKLSNIAIEENEFIKKNVEDQYRDIIIEEKIFEKEVYSENKMPTIILDLKEFNNKDLFIRKKIILYAIKKLFGDTKGIEKIHIEDIIKLCDNNIGNKFLTPNKKIKVVIKNKKIYIIRLS